MYAWDDEVGLFIPYSLTMRAVLNEISDQKSLPKEDVLERLGKNFKMDEVAFCYDWLKKWNKIRPKNYNAQTPQNLSASNVRSYVLKSGLLQLTLGVTEDCNFRCKYCVFSDNYEYTRNHYKNYMNFTIAKKAIDYYLSLLKEGRRYNPIRKPSMGFYGGEPLLNFKLIKECVEYIEKIYSSCGMRYNLTTNGSLLDEEKADWLMQHNFSISISLNGPEGEHDRLRVYSNGKGTFGDIMKNVRHIVDEGYEKIYSILVFDWKSDLFNIEKFFNRVDVPPLLNISLVSNVKGCKYYEQFTKKDYLVFLASLKKARRCYFKEFSHQRQKVSFFDKLIGEPLGSVLFDTISIYSPLPIMPFTGACVPGRKVFADVDGNFHTCEKINNNYPFGNVDDGLNFEKISKLMSDYISSMDKCPTCKVRRRCRNCYQNFATDKGFLHSSEVCRHVESAMRRSIVEAFEIAEIDPEFVEEIINIRYKNT